MEQLIRLQNIDTKLKDLNDLLGDLPSKVEDLNNQEESTKNSITTKKSRSKELDVEISKTELEVSDLSGKIDKLKDQLFLVTNNKQYDALMLEIDHLKEGLDRNETTELELLQADPSLPEAPILLSRYDPNLLSNDQFLTLEHRIVYCLSLKKVDLLAYQSFP
jgi:predicted  nucleic acid-binding Zn-ribbon protein